MAESEIVTLEAAAANGPHPRMRRRAQAVLGHHRGLCLGQLATLYAVGYNAISRWLLRWQRHGVADLAEGLRRPAPQIARTGPKKIADALTPATQQLRTWLPRILSSGTSPCT